MRAALGLGVLGLALAGVVITGALPRLQRTLPNERAHAQQALQTDPNVNVVAPTTMTGSSLLLPGNIQAAEETVIYARTSGYLRRRYVDIGSKVRAGQLLAEIESPEVDQQLRQAQAETLKSEAGTGQAIADTARLKASVAQAISDTVPLTRQSGESAVPKRSAPRRNWRNAGPPPPTPSAQLALAKQNLEGKRADLQQAQAHLDIAAKTSAAMAEARAGRRGLAAGRRRAACDLSMPTKRACGLTSPPSFRRRHKSKRRSRTSMSSEAQIAGGAGRYSHERAGHPGGAAAALASGEANMQAARESVNAGRQNVAAAQAGTLSSQANVQRVGGPEVVRAGDRALLRRHHLPQRG